jgi:hypothetical protein
MTMRDGSTIGDLARRCGVSRDALRFYERERLLVPPRRSASGYRLYGLSVLRRQAMKKALSVLAVAALGLVPATQATDSARTTLAYDPAKTDPKTIAESVSKTGFEASVEETADSKKGR